MDSKLTAKQARFVEEYLVDLNATQAAIRAGYAAGGASVEGHRQLTNVNVAAAIAAALEERSERTGITQDWVLESLRAVAQRCMQAVPVTDKSGGAVLVETPTGELAPAFTFQAAGACRSLELLGKHLGMFADKVDHDHKHSFEDALEALLARKAERGRPAVH